jgi:hypothetical protein
VVVAQENNGHPFPRPDDAGLALRERLEHLKRRLGCGD